MLDNSDGPSFSPNFCPKKFPLGKFLNNSVHAVGRFGLWIFPGYTPTITGRCVDTSPSAATFDTFISYMNDIGAELDMANNIQFKNFVVYDQLTAGIVSTSIVGNNVPNTKYAATFYNENIGPSIKDSIIIGNSDSSATSSIGQNGLIIAWDRGQLIKNVTFINFPDINSVAIEGPVIAGTCE